MFITAARILVLPLVLSGLVTLGKTFLLGAQEETPTTGEVPKRYWQDMNTDEFAVLDAERVIAVLPVAAIEQRGPYLPVCADACSN